MLRWPYFGEADQAPPENSHLPDKGGADRSTPQESSNLELQDIFSDYVGKLSQYCQKYYFPPNYSDIDVSHMIKTVYETSGSIYEAKEHTAVFLEVPPMSSHCKDIEYALRRVNERHIFDHFGRKLRIEI